MASRGVDAERAYVRAMFELIGETVRQADATARRGGPTDADEHEAAAQELLRRTIGHMEALEPPASLAEFHAEYVARAREEAERPIQRTERSGRRLMPEGQYERQERNMELLRVLFAVATDEEVALAGLPPDKRWEFVVGDDDGTPREEFIMVGRDERDWREKLRAEMERRGMLERDIEEVMRRLEQQRDEHGGMRDEG